MTQFFLSNRHIKEAQAFESFLAPIAEQFSPAQFKKRPFELLFRALGPMIIPGVIGKAFAFYLETIGYGMSHIGKWVDEALGFHSGKPDVSDSSVHDAATRVVDKLGLTALAADDADLVKQGFGRGRGRGWGHSRGALGTLARALRGERVSPLSIIYRLISKYLKGVLGLAVMSGVVGAAKGKSLAPEYESRRDPEKKKDYWVPGTPPPLIEKSRVPKPSGATKPTSELFTAIKGVLS